MVAGHLYQQFAAISCQLGIRPLSPSYSVIDITRNVYATYVSFEGISYLHFLENSTHGGDFENRCISIGGQGKLTRTIYVAYDHIGIRNIYFELPKLEDVPPSFLSGCGVWWKQKTRHNGLERLIAHFDVRSSKR